MTAATEQQLQELYVAYFGRAADPSGLSHWVNSGISQSRFAADMYLQAEFADVIDGLSIDSQINQLYVNLFGRNADQDGLDHWVDEVQAGNIQVAEVATHLIWAAYNNESEYDDKATLENKVAAAEAYTAELKANIDARLAYQALDSDADSYDAGANFAEGKSFITGVDADNPHTEAALEASVQAVADYGVPSEYVAPVVEDADPTYTVTADASTIDEGSTLTTSVTTTNVDSGTKLYYELSGTGVANTDFSSGNLTGSATVDSDGKISISHTLDNDLTTEGNETLEISLYSDSARTAQVGDTLYVTITDTSAAALNAVLTVGLDTGTSFTGTSAVDSFSGLNTTLTAGDVLKGGGGDDIFSLTSNLSANTTLAGFTTESVENFNVTVVDGDTTNAEVLTVNMANSAPTTIQLGGTSTTTVSDGATFTNVAAGTNLSMLNATDLDATITYTTAARAGTADEATLTLNTVLNTAAADTDIAYTSGGAATSSINTLNIVTAGAANNIGNLAFGGSKIVVTGDQTLDIDDDLEGTIDEIDGSAFTGILDVDMADDTTTPNATVDSVDVVDITITGGTGNDIIDMASLGTDNEMLITTGDGDDEIIIGATALTNATSTNVGDVITGGDGTDTLNADVDVVDNTQIASTAALTGVTGIETLDLSGTMGGGDTVTLSRISSEINRVDISSVTAGAGLTLTYGSGASTLGLNIAAAVTAGDTLTANAAGSGTADSLTITNMLTTGNSGSATSAYAITGFETVTFNTGDYATASAQNVQTFSVGANTLKILGSNAFTTAGTVTATTIDASDATGAVTLGAASTSVTTITGGTGDDVLLGDASSTIDGGLGDDTVTGGTGNDTLTGGAGADTITTNTGTDTVDAGTGNDSVNVDNALTAGDVIDGGAGTDTLILDAAATAATAQSVSNFEILQVETAATQDMAVFTANSGFTTVDVDVAGAVVINNANDTVTTARNTTTGGTLTFARLVDDTSNALTVEADDSTTASQGVTTFTAITANNEETITLTSGSNTAEVLTVTTLTGTDLTTLTLTGTANVVVTNAVASATLLATVDSTGLTGSAEVHATSVSTVDMTFTAGNGGAEFTGGNGDDTINGGTGVDILIGGLGSDTLSGGAGADTTINGGIGADTLTGGGGDDNFVQTTAQSVAATGIIDNTTATTMAAGVTVAVNDKIVFGNGVDRITDFTAGAGGVDDINTLVAGAPTSGLGLAWTNMDSAGNNIDDLLFLSGAFNTSTNTFTVAANGSGADTLIFDMDASVSDDLWGSTSVFILSDVDSDDLVAADFI